MQKLLPTLAFAMSLLLTPAQAEDSGVVASIAPIHSLVSAVMDGVGTPTLVVRGNQSPHAFSLKPSDARALQNARVVFWVGPGLETALRRPLSQLARGAKIVELGNSAQIELLTLRNHGKNKVLGKEPDHTASRRDLHLWLSPRNALAITEIATGILAKTFPAHEDRITRNGQATMERIQRLDGSLRDQLRSVQDDTFAVFHDALQYFERAYSLQAPIVINPNPERRPGAARVRKVRQLLKRSKVRCIFSEPHLGTRQVEIYTEGTAANTVQLDPAGAGFEPGKDHYFNMMRSLADKISTCVAKNS
ncbi:MAG: zinc ABC transporter substrate-binding protein [Pseudomonadota bacterium]